MLEFPVNIRYKRGHKYILYSNMDINYLPAGIVSLVESSVVEDENVVVVVAVCFVMVEVGREVVLVVVLVSL